MKNHPVLAAVVLLLVSAAATQAQDIASRVRAAGSGTVRLTFASQPGVCGDGATYIATSGYTPGEGRSVFRTSKRGYSISTGTSDGHNWRDCEEGPLRVALEVQNGNVVGVESFVGKQWDAPALQVSSKAAVAYLLQLVEHSGSRVGRDALTPIILADSVEPWRDLLRIAKNTNVPRDTRKAAVFWVGQEVQDEATRGLSDVVREPGDLAVRKAAIFALSQQKSGDAVGALIAIAKTNPDKELRKTAIFWLGQSDDPRALAMFEEILLKR